MKELEMPTDMPKVYPDYAEAMKALVFFVTDLTKDETISAELRDKASEVVTNFLFASLMSLAKRGADKED